VRVRGDSNFGSRAAVPPRRGGGAITRAEAVGLEGPMKHVKVKRLDGVVVLSPHGYLVGGEETEELQQLIQDLANEGNTALVIDLADTEFINSWALGVLIGGHVNYSKRAARMKLCNVAQKISNLFTITRLNSVFEVYDSEERAVASFSGG
jgi:anti-sigma B factor antagonist